MSSPTFDYDALQKIAEDADASPYDKDVFADASDDFAALIAHARSLESQLAESQRENERLEAELRIVKNPGAWAGPS